MELYGTNNVEVASETLSYVGYEDINGKWFIKKVAVNGNLTTFTYASSLRNKEITSYADAWTNKATLNYTLYNLAFN